MGKFKKYFMYYMYVMQFIFSMIGLALLGYFIGGRIDPNSELQTILTAVGLALGVFVGFVTLVKMLKSEERNERSSRN